MVLASVAGVSQFRVIPGQRLQLHTIASSAVVLRAYARIQYDDPNLAQEDVLYVPDATLSANRIEQDFFSDNVAAGYGWVVQASVELQTTGIKRGQVYAVMAMSPTGVVLSRGYVYQNHWPGLSEFSESGPGGGEGYKRWEIVKQDTVPVASTSAALALSNTYRRIHGFAWYYNCAAEVASRTLAVNWTTPALARPTGFASVNNADVWRTSTLTLTTGEEGTIFASPTFFVLNTDGVLTAVDMRTNPTPFPLEVPEDDLGVLLYTAGSLHANDRDSIYQLVEEWLLL